MSEFKLDKNTLASDMSESMDRVVRNTTFCVCGDPSFDHKPVEIDHPLNSDSIQMIERWDCMKCDCGKYRERPNLSRR